MMSTFSQSDEKSILFNATGSKFATLQDFIINSERKKIVKQAKSHLSKSQMKVCKIESDMVERKTKILRQHLLESPMQKVNKMTILGDELALREAADNRLGLNGRDGLSGRTALHDAAASGHSFILRVLCREYGVDIEKHAALGGVTALHLAVANGHRPVCYLLLQQGASIRVKDKLGNTPMHYVTNKSIAKLLLSKGASLLCKNAAGRTPSQYYLLMTPLEAQDAKLLSYLHQCEEEERKAVFAADVEAFHRLTAAEFNDESHSFGDISDSPSTSSVVSSQHSNRPFGR